MALALTNTAIIITKNTLMLKKIINKFFDIHPNAMSFRNSIDLAELPVVTFYQGSKKINFLLDTGSNNCIINSSYLKNLNHRIVCNVENTVTGIEGNGQKAEGVCTFAMSYKDKIYEYAFVIQDMSGVFNSIKKETGVTIHGILGSKFFNDYKYVLDFKELIVYSKE